MAATLASMLLGVCAVDCDEPIVEDVRVVFFCQVLEMEATSVVA